MKRSSFMYLAPGASGAHAVRLPGASMPQSQPPPQPRIDQRVVTPETREECIDGRVMHALPANLEHAATHAGVDYVLRASAAPGYMTATDMLTRTSEDWDFAADSAILKQGVDPDTGTRYLEELAFEIKHTQRMSELTRRAGQLIGRGVRRVFVICVEPGQKPGQVCAGPVLEWSQGAWIELPEDGVIEDACLRCPVPVRALIDATEADNAVAQALLSRENPVLRASEGRAYHRGEAQGYDRGLREAILDLCEMLELEVTPERRARLEGAGTEELRALRAALKSRRQWP
jgi:hypothetical protein